MKSTAWQQYQEDAAAVFRELGCVSNTETRVPGARGVHKVDVKVELKTLGVTQLWVVECKRLSRPVSKAAVAAFQYIVNDIGAEKGFLLSETGFQPGAMAAARLTNVSLLSLAALKETTAHELLVQHLSKLEAKTLQLVERLKYLQIDVPHAAFGTVSRARPGANLKNALEGRVWLSDVLSALQDVKVGKYRYSIPSVFPHDTACMVKLVNPHLLLAEGNRLVAEVGIWYEGQLARTERAARLLALRPSSRVV